MDGGKRRKKRLRLFGVVLLALACVAGVELAVCRAMDPDMYRRITEPAAGLVRTIRERGSALAERWESARNDARSDASEQAPAPVSQEIREPSQEDQDLTQDPAATQFVRRQDREVLTGGVVELVYFNQGEEPWADALFGPDPIRGFGCGPTATAMVVSSLGSQVVDPARMAQLADEAGYCAPGSGSYLSIVQGMARAFDLDAESCGAISADELRQMLASGKLLVALMGPGHFTDGGHFIVLRGVTLTGQVLVADPNSRERSLALWDPQLILDELSDSRSSGAPLWCFSALGS